MVQFGIAIDATTMELRIVRFVPSVWPARHHSHSQSQSQEDAFSSVRILWGRATFMATSFKNVKKYNLIQKMS